MEPPIERLPNQLVLPAARRPKGDFDHGRIGLSAQPLETPAIEGLHALLRPEPLDSIARLPSALLLGE
jgi:hypothetical protein